MKRMHYIILAVLAAVIAGCMNAHAQPSDTIVANPKAVTLRNIWKVTGVNNQDRVGDGVGSVPDLNGDSLNEFLVHFGSEAKWKLFFGGKPEPDKTPEWEAIISAPTPSYPIIGDFRGDGRLSAVSGQYRFWDSPERYLLFFFQQEGSAFTDVPDPVLNPLESMTPSALIYPTDVIARNLDDRRGDELILSIGVHTRESNRSQVGEIWMYEGGPEFQVDAPTLVITDQETNTKEDDYKIYVADFDGDSYLDLALTARYADGSKLKLWFGRDGSPWNWTDQPDRTVLIDGSGLNRQLTVAHLDGDSIADVVGFVADGDRRLVTCYLSGAGKDFRTRSFAVDDADRILRTHRMVPPGINIGYLNDTARRYEMLPLIGPSFFESDEPMMLLFSGGENGPDAAWDALYAPSRDGVTAGGVMKHIAPLPDCNGDGWDDLLISDDSWWWDVLDLGIAMVLAGGPEIPTTGVREEPMAGEAGGLFLWPNPARDELNIAWKGNLRTMPHRFAVHDVAGKRVASGTIEPYVGAARWQCGDVPAGAYVLTAFDENGQVIASTTIIRE